MEFKGTKGKWISRYNNSYWEVNREEDFEDGKRLAVSVMVFNIEDGNCEFDVSHEDKANAQLIAAAPEMLNMLQRIRKESSKVLSYFEAHDERVSDLDNLLCESIDIIAKALGEEADDE